MEDVQNSSDQDNSNANDVMESLGVDSESNGSNESEGKETSKDQLPVGFLKELKRRDRKYNRDVSALQEQIARMQQQLQSPQQSMQQNSMPQYNESPQGLTIEEQIQRGVRYALEAKDAEERKAKDAERMAHVHRQYERLNNEFDRASDKYEDFDDVVRGHDAPFTPAIRDALLMVDNPSDVAYKLGKNREELHRISQLHPLEQAREVNKLSFALLGGNGSGKSSAPNQKPNVMGNMKANPVINSQNMSAQSIRARMKTGSWK